MFGYPARGRTDNTARAEWVNLFTLRAVDATGWSGCDSENLDVYVHKDGIRTKSFSPFYAYAA